jgi:hypothetical protein
MIAEYASWFWSPARTRPIDGCAKADIGNRASGVETGVRCDPCPACNVVSKPNISPVMLGLDKIALRYWTDELVTR